MAAAGGHKEATRIIWLVVYSDLITNLLLFAMILFAMSRLSKAQAAKVAESVALAFASEEEAAAAARREEAKLAAVRAILSLHRDLRQAGAALAFGPDDLRIDLPAAGAFEPGSAAPRALWPVLDRLGPELQRYPYPIAVEAHTDDLPPPAGGPFRSNWELSYAMARNVADRLAERWDLPAERLSVLGRGPGLPLAPNDGPENRARNRRVSIVLRTPEAWP